MTSANLRKGGKETKWIALQYYSILRLAVLGLKRQRDLKLLKNVKVA